MMLSEVGSMFTFIHINAPIADVCKINKGIVVDESCTQFLSGYSIFTYLSTYASMTNT